MPDQLPPWPARSPRYSTDRKVLIALAATLSGLIVLALILLSGSSV
jgi:hypothetical protein